MRNADEFQQRREPNSALCSTTSVKVSTRGITTELFYCNEYDLECKHAWLFGNDCLCQHPEKIKFTIEGTRVNTV